MSNVIQPPGQGLQRDAGPVACADDGVVRVDVLQGVKDSVNNFVKWMRANGHPCPAEAHTEALVEQFLSTQHSGNRFGDACAHCGSSEIEATSGECQLCKRAGIPELRRKAQEAAARVAEQMAKEHHAASVTLR